MIQRTSYLQQIQPFMDSDLVKVLTGIRRSGKSVLLLQIQQELIEREVSSEQIIYLNFEDLSNYHLLNFLELHKEIKDRASKIGKKVYLFFDEIQDVQGWERCINSFRVELDCDIYITGSNARLLSGELATYLAGRYIEITVYPFSFREFMELYQTINPESDAKECFSQYLHFGGMPYLSNLQYNKDPCRQYLQEIYNSVQLRDIIRRNNIRDADLLNRILGFVMTNAGNTITAASISKFLKNENRSVSATSVLNYLEYCCEAFLIYRVPRDDLQGKKVLKTMEKYYLADHGIREAILESNQRDIQLVLENLVFLEMKRRGYEVRVGKVGAQEVDFVGTKGGEKLYIQVSYLLASAQTIEREFGVFDEIHDNYPKLVVSMDELDFSRNGYHHWNIRDFLLAESWA